MGLALNDREQSGYHSPSDDGIQFLNQHLKWKMIHLRLRCGAVVRECVLLWLDEELMTAFLLLGELHPRECTL